MTVAHLTLVTLALVLAAGQSPAARSNAVTIRLVVTGATLPKPLTVTDAQILDRSNAYADDGFVYLPGRGEAGYRGNIGIMIRETGDGRWRRAAPEWADLLNGNWPHGR